MSSHLPIPPLSSLLMSQPAEEPSEKKQGNEKETATRKKKPEKRKQRQKANKKKGTYGLTKPEDKEPHRSVAQAQEVSSKPHMPQKASSQQRSTSTPEVSKSAATIKADSMPRPSGASPQVVAVPPNATWEEVAESALNSSILSGTFEDVKILACSRRSQALERHAGGVRALHANSALVRKALTSGHLLLDTDVLPDVLEDADIRDIDASFQTGHHEYLEDSDLEDGDINSGCEFEPEEQSDAEEDVVEEQTVGSAKTVASEPDPSTGEARSKGVTETPDAGTHEDGDDTSTKLGDAASAQDYPGEVGEHKAEALSEEASSSKTTGPVRADDLEVPLEQPSKANNGGRREIGPATRTVLVTDTAFQTLRTFIFYAYTGRVAFAPLRSQGMIYQDGAKDPSQLPICSPKSMYRLAVKYGNEALRMQAGTDIQSKLSTQNILDELFSNFTCRYPEIQDMELNFLLGYIKHPDVTIRLPWWISRFAQGHLAACADTFGMLIHKLACVAAPPDQFGGPKPPSFCPQGCPMPTIRTQFRCNTCGYVMT